MIKTEETEMDVDIVPCLEFNYMQLKNGFKPLDKKLVSKTREKNISRYFKLKLRIFVEKAVDGGRQAFTKRYSR